MEIDTERSFCRGVWIELADDGPLLVVFAGLVCLSAFGGIGWPSLAGVSGSMITLYVLEAVRSAAGVPEYGSGIVVGAGVAGYSTSVLHTGGGWTAALFFLVGVWFVLDACYEWRRGINSPDSPAEELIATTLVESSTPLRPNAIADRTGLTLEAVERTLEERAGGGAIQQVGNRYTIRDPPTGSIDCLWNGIPWPLRLFSGGSWR